MNKKKLVSLCLVLALAVTAAIGGTMAYFTDTDSATNVMTTGKVNIIQNEKNLDGSDFTQNQPLYPAVNKITEGEFVENGYFNTGLENVITKEVTVTNEAKDGAINQDAYVRTILLFETADVYKAGTNEVIADAHDQYIGVLGDFDYLKNGEEFVKVEVDGVEYVVAYKVYDDALAPGKTTEPSLKQFFLSPDANNEVMDLFGAEYTILALSQAVQTEGFANAVDALNTAFGEINATNVGAWF